MLYLIQIINMLSKSDQQRFVTIFHDLSFEIEEMGFKGYETELVKDLLWTHFDLEMASEVQLQWLTTCILRHQKNMDRLVSMVYLGIGTEVA